MHWGASVVRNTACPQDAQRQACSAGRACPHQWSTTLYRPGFSGHKILLCGRPEPAHSCPSDAPVRDAAARFEPGEWPIGGRAHQRPGSLRADVGAQLIAGERPCAWDHGDWLGCIAQAGL